MAVVMITTKSQWRPSFLMSLSHVLFIIIFIFFSFTGALNFSFNSFTPDDTRISYEGNANVDPQKRTIELIPDILRINSVGWATYSEPFQLWDEASGNLSNFNTRFSFTIDSQGNPWHGYGLAFFLAPAGSKRNLRTTDVGRMGLPGHNANEHNTREDPFVAVEFDISSAFADPEYEHIGIDVNSMWSVTTTRWWYTLHEEKPNEAWISYNSSSKQLSVHFTSWHDSELLNYSLFWKIDLKKVLPPRVTVGFSASTGTWTALHSIYSWDFNSTLLVGKSLDHTKRSQLVVGLAVGGGFVLIGAFALAGHYLWKWIKRSKEDVLYRHLTDDFEKGTGPRKFSYHEVKSATNNFDHEAKLGEGGFGSVYKGFLRELNSSVAVKKLAEESKQGLQEYASEVNVISQLRHRNLVKLIGWCHEKSKLLLVYEYMPNGSLDRHLLNATELLIWEIRYKIVQGLASALQYLHEGWEQCVVHRDIKPSNIMLDSGFNPKLGDFGLARFVDHAKGSKTTDVAGTRGYMAPEYVITSKATKESDMYSFGIVVLEIACGRRPIDPKAPEGQIVMVDWVWELYEEGKILEAADPRFKLGDYDEQQMEKLMLVGLWCAVPDSSLRPSIRRVTCVLHDEVPLPSLPPRMPMDHSPTTSSLGYNSAKSELEMATNQLSITSS